MRIRIDDGHALQNGRLCDHIHVVIPMFANELVPRLN
jgi:hypothetical protein